MVYPFYCRRHLSNAPKTVYFHRGNELEAMSERAKEQPLQSGGAGKGSRGVMFLTLNESEPGSGKAKNSVNLAPDLNPESELQHGSRCHVYTP